MAKGKMVYAGAAALALAWAAPAQASCAWSIGMLHKDIALIEEIAPIAANANKDVKESFQTALSEAKSALARAEVLNARGDLGACEYAVSAARDQATAARASMAKLKNG